MSFKILRPAALAVLALLAGCAQWQMVKPGKFDAPRSGYAVKLPEGWLTPKPAKPDHILLTEDGLGLDEIVINRFDNDKAFPKTKKTVSPDMLPSDLADVFIAENKQDGNDGTEVKDNSPALVGGKPGFRVEFEFKTADGLRYRSVTYGLCTADGFYMLMYKAPELYYFDHGLPAFKSVVDSFRLTENSVAQAPPEPTRMEPGN